MYPLLFTVTTDLNYDQRMQRICGSLAAHGYPVLLVGREWPTSRPLTPQSYRQHRLRCYFTKGKLFYLEFSLRLFFYLLTQKASLWCAIDLDTALPVWLRACLAGQPFVYDAHELFTEVPEVVARPGIRRVWLAIERLIVPRAARAYTVGPALARVFEQRYGRPFSVIRNISRLEEQELPPAPAAAPPGGYILYQGALNAGRGLEALLEAMPQVAGRLVICGEGDLSAALRERAVALGLLATGQVEFRGFVLPAALREVTRHAAVGIMLLENQGLSYYYSLANKFFDYLHAGIPQLIVDFPEYRVLNDQYDVAEVVALTPEALAAALNRLLRDEPARYHQLAQNCRRARRELSWQHEEKQLLALYGELLAPHSIPA
ncbi:Glycosyltransferase involved in cell wall bisynthesis [Hymenobacter daecheongensis DSM 21074]|uniref:Glycosyltransferase involved in cell wall bisynthesis n=1 Tax=Hymenobacter daecheongensis DSM 21074 TaxID=1121955 RepID=A0A1M6I462_9BACT|nr:glycosyltransferase [Hymenobacter daecheongensis]SHJ29209.1 Glycosyltransferase involved in cell wall bisynthesis [Hymenobacter daecheongensis DSM 21074]